MASQLEVGKELNAEQIAEIIEKEYTLGDIDRHQTSGF